MRRGIAGRLTRRAIHGLDALDALEIGGASWRWARALVVHRALGFGTIRRNRAFVIRAHQAERAVTLLILDSDLGAVGG